MNICDCIDLDGIELDVQVPTKSGLLQRLAQRSALAAGLDEPGILQALESRERLGSTGIGAGIALPHAAIAGLARPYGFIARLGKPVAFDSIDGEPVDIACLVLTPTQERRQHLTLLSRIAKVLRTPEALARIRAARSPEEVHAVLAVGD